MTQMSPQPSATVLTRLAQMLVLTVTVLVANSYAGSGWAVLSATFLIASFFIANRSYRIFDPRRVTIASFWYLTYVAMIYIPAFFVFADQSAPYRSTFLFSVQTVLITVPLGWQLTSYVSGFSPIETDVFFLRPVEPLHAPKRFDLTYGLILAVAIISGILYVRTVPAIPLFQLLSGSGDHLELALLREDSFKLLNSRFAYLFYMVRGLFFPLLIALAFAVYLSYRQAKWKRILLFVLPLGTLFAALSIAKSPVAAIFLILAIIYYYCRRGIPSRKSILVFFCLIFAFPVAVVMSASRGTDISIWDALQGTGYRLFYIPAETAYFYFEMFPKDTPYLHGRSVGKLALLLGQRPEDVTQTVAQYSTSEGLETDTANAAFLANWHADFGLVGVLFGGLLAGCVMHAFHISLVRRSKNAITIAIYAFLVYAFWLLQSTSLPIVLLSDGAGPALVLAWVLDGFHFRYRVPGTKLA